MPLINCPDCEKQISDRATSCIHCGCPISGVDTNSSIAKIINEISKTEKTSRTCPKCQATQGFRTIGSILGNDAILINTNSVTSGNVFNAENGKLLEEYQEETVTSGTHNSVLVSTIQKVFGYWSSRNPDPLRKAEFLDVFTCGTCLAVIDKDDRASTLDAAAEQVFLGKALYGSWNKFFLPVDLPIDALDLVVRHTLSGIKLFKNNGPLFGTSEMKFVIKEENRTDVNEGPLFYWSASASQTIENPLTRLNDKAKMKWEKNLEIKANARNEAKMESRTRVAVKVVHKGETGIEIDLFLKTKTGLISNLVGEMFVDSASEVKDYFTRTFVQNFMSAMDLYAIKRLDGIPEEQIKEFFNLASN
jgi:hypothetical protein